MLHWTDPRDGARWLVQRRWFRHGTFGYLPTATLLFASESEFWTVQEGSAPPVDLDDAYLIAALDGARRYGEDGEMGRRVGS